MSELQKFQSIIGYQFHNEELLKQALTHSSYANEKHLKKLSDNERLEFLGDAVLELTSSEILFANYPHLTEGELTKLRASIVCEPTLALCTEAIHLGHFLFLGKGEDQTGGRKRKSVLSDALEAVIGAIYLDGGFANAKEFIKNFVLNDLENKKLFYDSKTILQEIVQKDDHNEGDIVYRLTGESGPDHDKTFSVELYVAGKLESSGKGRNKKAAEQDAAYQCLLKWKSQQEK